MRSSSPLDVFIDILNIEPSITCILGPKPLCTRVLFLNTWQRFIDFSEPPPIWNLSRPYEVQFPVGRFHRYLKHRTQHNMNLGHSEIYHGHIWKSRRPHNMDGYLLSLDTGKVNCHGWRVNKSPIIDISALGQPDHYLGRISPDYCGRGFKLSEFRPLGNLRRPLDQCSFGHWSWDLDTLHRCMCGQMY